MCTRALIKSSVSLYTPRERKKGNEPREIARDFCSSETFRAPHSDVADWNVALAAGAPHEIKDHSVRQLLEQTRETDATLGEFVDVYQIHSATFESGVLRDAAVLAELARLKRDRGWRVGLSVSSPQQAAVLAAAREAHDGTLFDTVQCTFNVPHPRRGRTTLESLSLSL